MKRCNNSDCIRSVWDRDVNAFINSLNLFLELCYSAKEDGKGQRLKAFTRWRNEFGLWIATNQVVFASRYRFSWRKDFTEFSILQFSKIEICLYVFTFFLIGVCDYISCPINDCLWWERQQTSWSGSLQTRHGQLLGYRIPIRPGRMRAISNIQNFEEKIK